MILFFDTETTGLPKDWKAPASDVNNWPRMIQLAFLLCLDPTEGPGGEPAIIQGGNYIIRPDGFQIPEEASKIHGITTEKAMDEGRPLMEVLFEFQNTILESEMIAGHNIAFDRKIVSSEFHRAGLEDVLDGKTKACTMMASTKFCAIPGKYGPKWPKLQELHNKLFGADFAGAHDALADIEATAKCYFELVRLGVMPPAAQEIANHQANKAAKDARMAANQ